MKVAEEVCNERIAIVLEGGYNLEALPRIIAAIITTLAEIKDIELSDPYLIPKQIVSSTVKKDILKMKALLADYWKVF